MSICTWSSLQSTARPLAACLQLMSSPTRPQPALTPPWTRPPATPCPPMSANRPLTLRKPSYRIPRDSYKHTHLQSERKNIQLTQRYPLLFFKTLQTNTDSDQDRMCRLLTTNRWCSHRVVLIHLILLWSLL